MPKVITTRASSSLAAVGRHCKLCKTVMSQSEGGPGHGPFGRVVDCCPDCLVGYAPSSYAVVQPRLGRKKMVGTTDWYKPAAIGTLPIGERGKKYDPRPQLTASTAVRISQTTQSARFAGANERYKPPARFRVA